MTPLTTKIVETDEGPAAVLPEGFRFDSRLVRIRPDGDAVVLEPLTPSQWPKGFFDAIRIDDPAFERPD